MLLEGRSGQLIDDLTSLMKDAAAAQQFELAAELRDRIRAIESVREKQKVSAGQVIDRDILAIARAGTVVSAVALQVREGLLIGRQNFQLTADAADEEPEILAGFINNPKVAFLSCIFVGHYLIDLAQFQIFAIFVFRTKGKYFLGVFSCHS